MKDRRLLLRAALTLALALLPAAALAQPGPAEVESRVRALRDPDAEVRRNAAEGLARLGPGAVEAVPALVAALDDPDLGVRWHSAVALGTMGPGAVAPLVGALRGTNATTRQGAALALGKMGPGASAALDPLIDALKDSDASVRERAAETLGLLGPGAATAVGALVRVLSDADPYVEGKAAEALGRFGRDAVPALALALGDRERTVRWCAAIALGRIGAAAREAVPALTGALQDADENVRWCAVIALGSVGGQAAGAVPALVRCLHDKDEDVRWGANLALEQIDPELGKRAPGWRSVAATMETLTPVLMNELHVPGVSVALIADRRVVWSKSFGVADVTKGTPATGETLFEACSMSKPVFAYLVMKLVELGKLDLDRPLAEYLPLDDPPTQKDKQLITARAALSHTTGLPNWRKGDEEREGPLPVTFRPGSRFSYSGEGIFYLQRVVEHITGEPLEVYAQRALFGPLGLRRMSYVWTPDLEPALASGHDADGKFLKRTKYAHANAAYSLYTTALDYAAFIVEIMESGRSAGHSLSQQSIESMLGHQVALDARDPIERPGSARGLAVYWGLGWSVNTSAAGDIVHHSGSNRSGFRCFSQFNPGKGSGIVIMTNGTNGGDLWTRLISEVGDL
ncbi:MAG: serine hydrolase [Thermoanaerobaculaceae bacterium]|jgi:CubicO group peptidase (beta-lactamase class C family)